MQLNSTAVRRSRSRANAPTARNTGTRTLEPTPEAWATVEPVQVPVTARFGLSEREMVALLAMHSTKTSVELGTVNALASEILRLRDYWGMRVVQGAARTVFEYDLEPRSRQDGWTAERQARRRWCARHVAGMLASHSPRLIVALDGDR
ncbi:hypothetical protein [Pseudofrankia sp. DC12]|uniref:hypothetical protein n=1 Tax=Pseudofrankia sp. DC12 TaxID=683315 RepID=UPI0005F8711C|nr:hypothetical protein [Pseudofrankia sp. DC12]